MLSGGNDDGAFSLSSSGQLSLTQTLDREAQEKYILLITATDSGTTRVKLWVASTWNVNKIDFIVRQNDLFVFKLLTTFTYHDAAGESLCNVSIETHFVINQNNPADKEHFHKQQCQQTGFQFHSARFVWHNKTQTLVHF